MKYRIYNITDQRIERESDDLPKLMMEFGNGNLIADPPRNRKFVVQEVKDGGSRDVATITLWRKL